jgi:TolB-like protein/DNA-binding winged helix-turn-helix (wHTH) protein
MSAPSAIATVARFGPYEVDVRSGELRKFGIRVRLGEQPLQILLFLLEHPGEVVTREDLRSRLWSFDIHVDFDHGLNSAVQRLRESLSDTAEKAHWIETVPRRGYRFVGKVEWTGGTESAPAAKKHPVIVQGNGDGNSPDSEDQQRPPISDAPGSSLPRRWSPLSPRLLGWLLVGVALLLAITGALVKIVNGQHAAHPAPVIRSLAVLPLQNLSGDSTQEFFADGMTDELITMLAKNSSLRVVSRTSAMQYKGVRRPVRDIAAELGVDAILEGSVARSGNRVHMTVQLIYAPLDTHIWAESYDRDLNEAVLLPSELSQTIAKEVRIAISPVSPPRPINPEAHDAYLRGRFFWFADNSAPTLEYFEKAIQLQPDYAAAWSGVSDYYAVQAVSGQVPPQEVATKWEAAARKSVELDDSLAEAHNAMAGWYLFYAWDPKQAEKESARSIALNPNYAEAYHLDSYVLLAQNRNDEAVQVQKKGMEIDPFARPWALGYAYYLARQFDAAVSELRVRETANPADVSTHAVLADAYHFAGQDKESALELEQVTQLRSGQKAARRLRLAYEQGGYKAVVERLFENSKTGSSKVYWGPFWRALESGRAQHREETLRLLEEAYRVHDPRLMFLRNEPVLDFVHTEPRFKAIVQKMGLATVN